MRTLMISMLTFVASLAPHLPRAMAGDLTVERTAIAVQTITVPPWSRLLLLFPPESEITAAGPLVFEFVDSSNVRANDKQTMAERNI